MAIMIKYYLNKNVLIEYLFPSNAITSYTLPRGQYTIFSDVPQSANNIDIDTHFCSPLGWKHSLKCI